MIIDLVVGFVAGSVVEFFAAKALSAAFGKAKAAVVTDYTSAVDAVKGVVSNLETVAQAKTAEAESSLQDMASAENVMKDAQTAATLAQAAADKLKAAL